MLQRQILRPAAICCLATLLLTVVASAQKPETTERTEQAGEAVTSVGDSSSTTFISQTLTGRNGGQTTYQQLPPQLQGRQFGNTPDDIGSQLRESQEPIDSLFPFGPLTPLHKTWSRCNRRSQKSCSLDLGVNYTTVYQRAAEGTGPRDAASDDIDFFGQWLLLGRDGGTPGLLAFSSEIRNPYHKITPSQLGASVGSAWGTAVAFNSQDYALVQMYWEQGSEETMLRYRIGKMDPALLYDGGRYVSSNYAFLSPAFSDTLPMALPGAGLGVATAVYPTENTYVLFGVHDANGRRTTAGFDTFFDVGEYFTALEFGAYPNDGDEDRGLWHLTLWHVDAREGAGRPSDHGVALTFEQELGERRNIVPFLRYAYADQGVNPIRQNLSLGVGLEDVLGQNEDLIGVAIGWGMPSDRSLQDEYVFETFYRFHLTPDAHFTPSLQVIIDPAMAPARDSVAVLGLRLRTLF